MASQNEELHFLLIPLMSQSHIIPITDFAKFLAHRGGVRVSIVTTPLNTIRYKSAVDHAARVGLKIKLLELEFPYKESGLPPGCENLDCLTSGGSVKDFFLASQKLLEPLERLVGGLNPKPSCIVATNALHWTRELSEKFGIPRYVFQTVSCFTLVCSRLIPKARSEDVDPDLKSSFLSSNSEKIVLRGLPHKLEFTRAQLPEANHPDDMKSMIDQMRQAQKTAQGVIVNTFEELEPWYVKEYNKLNKNVFCVGPVSLSNKGVHEKINRGNKASIDENLCTKWLDSMSPGSVIYACFGSLCHISPSQLKEIGLGLELSGHPFIWIIRSTNLSKEVEKWLKEEDFEERNRGRGLVIRGWAPQVLILSHPSVGGFLTHCGWNSTLEGICAGVPMITWPMFAEQFYNEKFLVNVLTIGVRIGVEAGMRSGEEEEEEESGVMVEREQLKKAIEKLMDEGNEGKERRRRAKEFAERARIAVEEGGSSYSNITMLIEDVIQVNNSKETRREIS